MIDTTSGKASENDASEKSTAETRKAGEGEKEEEKKEEEEEEEPEDEDTEEKVEERWKAAERLTELLAGQVKELENILNKIFHSSNPASRMQGLAENLQKAIAGDASAMDQCFFVFDAITNDKNMREILRSTKGEFEHFKKVITTCAELTQDKELRSVKNEAEPENGSQLI